MHLGILSADKIGHMIWETKQITFLDRKQSEYRTKVIGRKQIFPSFMYAF